MANPCRPPLRIPLPVRDAPLPKGHRLGSYEIVELLGQGAMGAVYLAQDLELPRRVAVKVPHRDRFRSPQEVERFLEEAGTIARLKHPGIVPIYHLGRDAEGMPFIVMEYIEGVSLEKMLQTERLPPARIAGLMAEIADAVHYAHRQGFIHRDLKPANVLLDKEGRPHVVDFGLAVHESVQRRKAGQYAGTPPYMAPEQVRGEAHRLDGRADVWALGVMLYEMLSGGHPFAGENWEDLADEIQHREPKPPRQTSGGDQVPAELERICLRCLCKELTGRYNTAGDVSRDLRRWLHPRPRFRRAALVGGLAAAALLLALGARQLWPRAHEPLPAAAPALSGSIDVLLWNPTDRSRRGLKLHDRGRCRCGPTTRFASRPD